MENYPFRPFESDEKPENSGEKKNAKKKKKTTRVPLPVKTSPAETQEVKEKKPSLDDLFDKAPDPDKKAEKSKSDKPDKVEDTEITDRPAAETDIAAQEISAETTESTDLTELVAAESDVIDQDTTKETDEPPQTLEGEFADEAVIITRGDEAEVQTPEATPETYTNQTETADTEPMPAAELEPEAAEYREPAPETPPAAEAYLASTERIEPTAGAETITTSTYYESVPSEPTTDERRRILDSESPTAAATPAESPKTYTRSEVNKAALNAEKRGLRRGVLTGGIVGWLLGRRGKKEALQNAAKTSEQQNQTIDKLTKDHAQAAEELAALRRTRDREDVSIESQPSRRPFEAQTYLQQAESGITTNHERTALTAKEAEALKSLEKTKQDLKNELPPEERPVEEEMLKAPAGHRFETSAWHRIEVDEKTGRAVDKPKFEYGEEYHKEQKQETIRRDAIEPMVAARVGTALLQGTSNDDVSNAKQQSSTGQSVKQPPTALDMLKDKEFVKQQLVKQASNPVIWISALGLVILLFLLGLFS